MLFLAVFCGFWCKNINQAFITLNCKDEHEDHYYSNSAFFSGSAGKAQNRYTDSIRSVLATATEPVEQLIFLIK
jgi:hypothetical protein